MNATFTISLVLRAAMLAGGITAVAQSPMCSFFAGPPSAPTHLSTFWNGRLVYRYSVFVPLSAPPMPLPQFWNPADCFLRYQNSSNACYVPHTFTTAEFVAGGVLITWDQPAWLTAPCSFTGQTLYSPPGSTFAVQPDIGYCTGSPCAPASPVVTIPSLITLQPMSQTTLPGLTVTFTVATAQLPGAPAVTYAWQQLGPTGNWTGLGITTSSFSTANAGSYRVVCTYQAGLTSEISSTATLTFAAATPGYAPFGNGCPGSLGVPGNVAFALPRVGQTLSVQVANVPTIAWLFVGASGLLQPIDLAAIGAPGCSWWTSGSDIGAAPIVPPALTWSLPIPYDPGLLGTPFFTQALSLDSTNQLGLVVSDAAAGVIGT